MPSNVNAVSPNSLGVQKIISKDREAPRATLALALLVTPSGSGSDQLTSTEHKMENDEKAGCTPNNFAEEGLRSDSGGNNNSFEGCEEAGNPVGPHSEGLELNFACAKEKNRQAQRRFRERQKTLVDSLKELVVALVSQVSERDSLMEKLREENRNLESRLLAAASAPPQVNNHLGPLMFNPGNNDANARQQQLSLLQLLTQSTDQRTAAQKPHGQVMTGQGQLLPGQGQLQLNGQGQLQLHEQGQLQLNGQGQLQLNGQGQLQLHEQGQLQLNGQGGVSSMQLNGQGGVSSMQLNGQGRVSSMQLNGQGGVSSMQLNGQGRVSSMQLNGQGGVSSMQLNGLGGVSSMQLNGQGGISSMQLDGLGGVSSMLGMHNLNSLHMPGAPRSNLMPIQLGNRLGQGTVFVPADANQAGVIQMGSSGLGVDHSNTAQQLLQLQSGMYGQLEGKLMHVLPPGYK
eukprot:gene1378-32744_t